MNVGGKACVSLYLCVAGLVLNECRRESMCLMYLCVAGLVLNE